MISQTASRIPAQESASYREKLEDFTTLVQTLYRDQKIVSDEQLEEEAYEVFGQESEVLYRAMDLNSFFDGQDPEAVFAHDVYPIAPHQFHKEDAQALSHGGQNPIMLRVIDPENHSFRKTPGFEDSDESVNFAPVVLRKMYDDVLYEIDIRTQSRDRDYFSDQDRQIRQITYVADKEASENACTKELLENYPNFASQYHRFADELINKPWNREQLRRDAFSQVLEVFDAQYDQEDLQSKQYKIMSQVAEYLTNIVLNPKKKISLVIGEDIDLVHFDKQEQHDQQARHQIVRDMLEEVDSYPAAAEYLQRTVPRIATPSDEAFRLQLHHLYDSQELPEWIADVV